MTNIRAPEPGPQPPVFLAAPCAIVAGYPAAAIAVVVRDLARRGGFDRVPPHQRAELLHTLDALDAAANAWRASASGRPEAVPAPPVPTSGQMTTTQAAALLGVSERRIRHLAPALGGTRPAGRWLLDRDAVLAEHERRQTA